MTAQTHYWLGRRPYLYVVTSGLFPAYSADGVLPGVSILGGNLTESPRPVDGVNAALAVTGGALNIVLLGAQDLAAIAAGLSITGGTLESTLQQLPVSPEGIAPGMALLSGALTAVLINTTPAPEGIAVGLALTSGVLT
jgi:hypothetical protein